MSYVYGISQILIEKKNTDGSYTPIFSGVATSITIDTNVSTKELHGAVLNDASATFSIYPRDVIAASADATVKVELAGVNAADLMSLLSDSDLNASYKITYTPANAESQVIDGLKLVSKSGSANYDDYTKLTLEFKRIVTA